VVITMNDTLKVPQISHDTGAWRTDRLPTHTSRQAITSPHTSPRVTVITPSSALADQTSAC